MFISVRKLGSLAALLELDDAGRLARLWCPEQHRELYVRDLLHQFEKKRGRQNDPQAVAAWLMPQLESSRTWRAELVMPGQFDEVFHQLLEERLIAEDGYIARMVPHAVCSVRATPSDEHQRSCETCWNANHVSHELAESWIEAQPDTPESVRRALDRSDVYRDCVIELGEFNAPVDPWASVDNTIIDLRLRVMPKHGRAACVLVHGLRAGETFGPLTQDPSEGSGYTRRAFKSALGLTFEQMLSLPYLLVLFATLGAKGALDSDDYRFLLLVQAFGPAPEAFDDFRSLGEMLGMKCLPDAVSDPVSVFGREVRFCWVTNV